MHRSLIRLDAILSPDVSVNEKADLSIESTINDTIVRVYLIISAKLKEARLGRGRVVKRSCRGAPGVPACGCERCCEAVRVRHCDG